MKIYRLKFMNNIICITYTRQKMLLKLDDILNVLDRDYLTSGPLHELTDMDCRRVLPHNDLYLTTIGAYHLVSSSKSSNRQRLRGWIAWILYHTFKFFQQKKLKYLTAQDIITEFGFCDLEYKLYTDNYLRLSKRGQWKKEIIINILNEMGWLPTWTQRLYV